jgi:hypothetical protein
MLLTLFYYTYTSPDTQFHLESVSNFQTVTNHAMAKINIKNTALGQHQSIWDEINVVSSACAESCIFFMICQCSSRIRLFIPCNCQQDLLPVYLHVKMPPKRHLILRPSLFWDVTHHRLAAGYQHYKTSMAPSWRVILLRLKVKQSQPLKMGPIGCPIIFVISS